jgi:hypothetical protein
MTRVWVQVELYLGKRNGDPDATVGRWATVEFIPRPGDWVFYSDDNWPAGSVIVQCVEHYLMEGNEDALVRIICNEEDLDFYGDESLGERVSELCKHGFMVSKLLWEADG